MGEIVIQIPSGKKRRYVMDDKAAVERLIEALDHAAVRVKQNSVSIRELEDLSDIVATNLAIRDIAKHGTVSWEEVKADLGL